MKKLALLLFAVLSLCAAPLHAQTPTAGPIQFTTLPPAGSSLATAGSFNQVPLTLGVGQYITGDQYGNPVAATFPAVPTLRAGTSTATTATLTRTVTFSSAMPSASYAIGLTGSSGLGALQMTYSNKTLTSFVINFSVSTSANVDWTATLAQ